jgi:hypothetical protein
MKTREITTSHVARIVPKVQNSEPRKEPNLSYRLMREIYPVSRRCSRTR